MTDNFPKASHDGLLPLGGVNTPVFVLEDGTRVITQRGLQTTVGISTSGGSGGAHRTASIVEKIEDKLNINNDLSLRMKTPFIFMPPSGARAYGYEATMLIDICELILKARDAGKLLSPQEKYAIAADIVIRAFAKVGIIAIIDEVTGYQDTRVKDALVKILEEFIAKEKRPYIGTFPVEFYRGIFRLNNWVWNEASTKRPGVIAHWTNDLVYERLAPGVLDELKKLNPTYRPGQRHRKLFQYLSEEVGEPKLRSHFDGLLALARASSNWRKFKDMVNRAYPKKWEQLLLHYDEKGDN